MATAGSGGTRRRLLSAAARERKNRRRRELRSQRKLVLQEKPQEGLERPVEAIATSPQDEAMQLQSSALLPLLASAAASSFRFLSDYDHLLLPSQSLALDSSISRLHSLLVRPPFPSPSSSAVVSGGDSRKSGGGAYWFLRFLASAASDGADCLWMETFRMRRSSFYLLLQTLAPSLSYSSPAASPAPPDHKLGAALFRLAHAAPFNAVARRFGMNGAAAACRAFYEVCRSVVDRLGHLFELRSDIKRVVEGFRWALSLPNCGGVLAFSRFPVSGSGGGSMVAQVVVDSEGRFLDVSAGWPGSMSPAQILNSSKLSTSPPTNSLSENLAGVGDENGANRLPPTRYLLGSSCCPLLPWLLTPFLQPSVAVEGRNHKAIFNEVHAEGMRLAAQAAEAVRLRWRLLAAEWSCECAEALPFVVVASCLLHNFLFKCSDMVASETLETAGEESFLEFEGGGDELGESTREAVAAHLCSVKRKG